MLNLAPEAISALRYQSKPTQGLFVSVVVTGYCRWKNRALLKATQLSSSRYLVERVESTTSSVTISAISIGSPLHI